MNLKILSLFLIIFLCFLPTLVKAKDISIEMTDWGFSPDYQVVTKGDKVIFKNIGKEGHWPASNIHPTHQIYPEFDPKKPVPLGQNWEFTFDKVGTWKYHDHLNPQLTGTITVTEKKEGWFAQSFNNIKNFFQDIFTKRDKKSASRVVDFPYNSAITLDDNTIFKDENNLRSYIKKFGAAQATKHLNELSSQFGDCHQIAHKAGRDAYEQHGEKAFQLCGGECHSGCYHGATEAYFKEHGTANLEKNLNTICNSELNPFFSHQCLHGIGHGLMAWTNYDLPEALRNCDKLTKGKESCYTGVFMENIIGALAQGSIDPWQSAQNGIHFTKYLSDDPQYPCNIVEDKYKGSCYFLQTSRMVQIFSGDYKKVAQGCLDAPAVYQRTCFESMGRDVGGATRGNSEKAISECFNSPEGNLRIGCLVGAVQDSFWDPSGQDEAISFCKLLINNEEKSACYSTISARSPQVLTSKTDQKAFCLKEENNYQADCLKYLSPS
jgi:plastocyanin